MCVSPLTVRVEKKLHKDSQVKIVSYQRVPCGKCPQCRNLRRLQWTFRLEQEALAHRYNYFITLTYSDKFLPHDRQIYKPDFSSFIKRLRSHMVRKLGSSARFKFFGCGEYGDEFGRCHFHCLLFSDVPIDYDDVKLNWTYGFIKYDPFTSSRAAYVVKYSQKQLFCDYPEGVVMPCSITSQNLGLSWLTPQMKRFYRNTLLTTCFTFNGSKIPLPRYYYDRIFNEGEKQFLARKHEQEHWKEYDKQVNMFGSRSVGAGQISAERLAWQKSYDNFISKPRLNFHYEEESFYSVH